VTPGQLESLTRAGVRLLELAILSVAARERPEGDDRDLVVAYVAPVVQ
jgi:hypothetical protein